MASLFKFMVTYKTGTLKIMLTCHYSRTWSKKPPRPHSCSKRLLFPRKALENKKHESDWIVVLLSE